MLKYGTLFATSYYKIITLTGKLSQTENETAFRLVK